MSPNPPAYLAIARIVAPWGARGEVKAEILTDFPERFASLEQVFLGPEQVPYRLEGARLVKDWVLLKFSGLDTPEAAESLRDLYVQIPTSQAVPLKPGQYYEHQVLGLEVWTEEGRYLGRVVEILVTGANDVCVVQDGAREILLPTIGDVIRQVDLEAGRMVVHLLEGLEE